MNTALETLVSQAFGRENHYECGVFLHRAMLMITLMFIPVAFGVFYTQSMLELLGVESGPARLAQVYMVTYIPGLLLNSWGDSIDIFLIGMGYSNLIMYIQITVIPFHVLYCYIFIKYLDMDVAGAAWASNATALTTFLIQIVYCQFKESIRPAWFWPTRKTLDNLKGFLKLALPGVLMMFLDNLNMQVLILMASLLKNTD